MTREEIIKYCKMRIKRAKKQQQDNSLFGQSKIIYTEYRYGLIDAYMDIIKLL